MDSSMGGSMGDNTSRNDLLGREAGWMVEEVGLNPSGATTINGEAEPLQCHHHDDNCDATVLMESSYEGEEDSLEAKKHLEIEPFLEAMVGESVDPMTTLMIQAICKRFPMRTVMKRVKSQFKRTVGSWDFEGDLTKEFGKDAKAAVRRIMDVEEVENTIVDEIVACLKWESLKARAISRILQNDVEAHPLIELMGDRRWTQLMAEGRAKNPVHHDDNSNGDGDDNGNGDGIGSVV
jgi:hypothetical protein